MEWIKNMGLKKSFFFLSAFSMMAALLLVGIVFIISRKITANYPAGGVTITYDGVIRELESPTKKQEQIVSMLGWIEVLSCILLPVFCLGAASLLFYRYKLKTPIAVLQTGMERIKEQDLAFSLPEVSTDELGQVCAAFETMRGELLRTNQELWRQAQERERLNAAFSHDLRNPITVLKGTVKLLKQGTEDEYALQRLETYVLRLERYVDAMSSIQRLEQMPVQKKEVALSVLRSETEDTAKLLAPAVEITVSAFVRGSDAYGAERNFYVEKAGPGDGIDGSGSGYIAADHGLFLTVAENLIGNAARYAKSRIEIRLGCCRNPERSGSQGGLEEKQTNYLSGNQCFLVLEVKDDGSGYPVKLVREGPRPFGRMDEDAEHFGMGLYSSQVLCRKHGGFLTLENGMEGGAEAKAVFSCDN